MSCWTGINSTGYRRPFQLDPIAIEKSPAKGILFILLQINGIKWEGTSPESITYGKTLPLIIDRPAIKKTGGAGGNRRNDKSGTEMDKRTVEFCGRRDRKIKEETRLCGL